MVSAPTRLIAYLRSSLGKNAPSLAETAMLGDGGLKLNYLRALASEIGTRRRTKLGNLWQQCIDFAL